MNNFVQLHTCLCVLEFWSYIAEKQTTTSLTNISHKTASTTRRQHTDRPQTKQSLAGSDTNPLSISRTDFFAARDDTPALRFPNLLEPVAAHAANTNHSQCWLNMTTPGPDYQNEAHNESWSCTTYHCLNCTRHAL